MRNNLLHINNGFSMHELVSSSYIEKPLLICNKLLRIHCKYSKDR